LVQIEQNIAVRLAENGQLVDAPAEATRVRQGYDSALTHLFAHAQANHRKP
jgi:hypothetical protein